MQQQYNQIKSQYPNEIVLFRLGDFYEAFYDDAKDLSHILGITLTGRGKGEKRTPMAGIPHHALDNYLPKIVEAGRKVVMVDQTSDPEPGKLVEREVSKVYTAGTLMEENTLDDYRSNFIASVVQEDEMMFVAVADASTGSFEYFRATPATAIQELSRIQPAELICHQSRLAQELQKRLDTEVTLRDSSEFEQKQAYKVLTTHFGTKNLKGFGLKETDLEVQAAGALLSYIQECHRTQLKHFVSMREYALGDSMQLDANTIRNLEILYPISGDSLDATIYSQLNNCSTSMGKRKLRNWLIYPLLDSDKLEERWDAVEQLVKESSTNSEIRSNLNEVADVQRIVGRLGVGSANARDLVALKDSLVAIQNLPTYLSEFESSRLQHIYSEVVENTAIQTVTDLISVAINPDPPAQLSEGGLIAKGFNQRVDELRDLKSGGKRTLAQIQQREISETNIPSLKVSYNKVFGYYIEVTKTHTSKVPEHYIRKQTLTNSERYITQELKDWEDKILNAETELFGLELELFNQVREQVAAHTSELQALANLIAELDVLCNFALIAREKQFVRPELVGSNHTVLKTESGRHFVVEALQNQFTPNNLEFDADTNLIILTGPNMSGKSTYIRQAAVLVLLAQAGTFVPATRMQFSLVDRIFTRVGASDNLSKGESTFMVEMNETANILNNATQSSLIILDEVGRGTSTFDGVSIAWAIVEFIQEKIKARTLFATHYHELTDLTQKYPQIQNYHVQVEEKGGEIRFTHKIAKGSTSKSYGVHVAKLAGVPKQVVARAEEILSKFESGKEAGKKESPAKPKKVSPYQLDLFD